MEEEDTCRGGPRTGRKTESRNCRYRGRPEAKTQTVAEVRRSPQDLRIRIEFPRSLLPRRTPHPFPSFPASLISQHFVRRIIYGVAHRRAAPPATAHLFPGSRPEPQNNLQVFHARFELDMVGDRGFTSR